MHASQAIKLRETTKMLGDPQNPLPELRDMRSILPGLIEAAGWAPFHRPAHTSHRTQAKAEIVEPWRFYLLDTKACRDLLRELAGWPEKSGKILNMLAAADALIQATWLPDPQADDAAGLFSATEENMEHIAAASAAIQNFLTAATSEGLRTYWSSGGVLRSPKLFAHLGIPQTEILLGSIFIFPSEPAQAVEVMTGKLRSQRSPHLCQWLD